MELEMIISAHRSLLPSPKLENLVCPFDADVLEQADAVPPGEQQFSSSHYFTDVITNTVIIRSRTLGLAGDRYQ
jgi:hypothetical protein